MIETHTESFADSDALQREEPHGGRRGGKHADYGAYKRVSEAIEELYVTQGVTPRAIAAAFGLDAKILSARLSDWGCIDLKRERDRSLAEEAAKRHLSRRP